MNIFHKPIGTNFQNNAMLVRISRQNLAEWKAERASWDSHIKKPTRKDKIDARNKRIRDSQKAKAKKKEVEPVVDWFEASFR